MNNIWNEQGVLLVPAVLSIAQIEKLREICSEIRDKWLVCDPLNGFPGGDPRFETCMRHVNHPSYFLNKKDILSEILEVCANKQMIDVLRECFGEEPMFRSTSLFFNPSLLCQEGNWHRDSQFVYKEIEKERAFLSLRALKGGDGIQIQFPLFDSSDLEYIAGSHRRWDKNHEFRIRLADNGSHCREPMPGNFRISASAGDAIFFDPDGIHRGRYFSTYPRLTLMMTYTRSSIEPKVDRFSYQPWFLKDDYLNGVSEESRILYERFILYYKKAWFSARNNLGRLHSGRKSI